MFVHLFLKVASLAGLIFLFLFMGAWWQLFRASANRLIARTDRSRIPDPALKNRRGLRLGTRLSFTSSTLGNGRRQQSISTVGVEQGGISSHWDQQVCTSHLSTSPVMTHLPTQQCVPLHLPSNDPSPHTTVCTSPPPQ